MEAKSNISSLLSQGDISTIAKEIGISPGAASAAIRRGNPGHKAVRLALLKAEQSGALAAAQQLAKLASVVQAV